MVRLDYSGKTYGFVVLGPFLCRNKWGDQVYSGTCMCGSIGRFTLGKLKSGHTTSCGCIRRELIRNLNMSHRDTVNKEWTPEYRAWVNMKTRCTNKKTPRYKDYGGRGIRICSRWLRSYSAFLADMGRKPFRTYSLERINNDGNYEPRNCRWATVSDQAKNRRPKANEAQ